jgi:DNA-binding CsgD family transcriptional regulator
MLALFTYPLEHCSATDVLDMTRHHGRVTVQCDRAYELVQTAPSPIRRDPTDGLDRLGLTPRETEVLRWVIEGKVTSEVGDILAISPRTVQKHLERIYQKLGVEGRTAAAVKGVEFLRDAVHSLD